jgi:para-aminobenzoate synthetase component 1
VTTASAARHVRRLGHGLTPEELLAAHVRRGARAPVLVPFSGGVVVAADPVETVQGGDVWDALRLRCRTESAGAPSAAGGWMGLLGYDLCGTVERLPAARPDPGGPPHGWLGRYETVAYFDTDGTCTLLSTRSEAAVDALTRVAAVPPPAGDDRPVPAGGEVRSSLGADGHRAAVDRARELIRAGDCYQVNLTQRLTAPWPDGPLALAGRLWAAAGRSSHRAYLGLGDGAVVSASPERLLRVANGVAESEPIKGTATSGQWERLAASAKDRAEHVMIVDLVRNDLGRVARPGGVAVPRLFGLLSTPYVEHMVSRVRAELADGVTATDVLRAVFPGGSVTGTPKVRAMEVIHELEPVSRGPAFGSMVAVGVDGAVEASITIRTAWVTEREARYWCGGAVVWDSDAGAEWDEAWAKARPFLDAVAPQERGGR